MVALAATVALLSRSEPFTKEADGYLLTVVPKTDGSGARVELSGPGTLNTVILDGKTIPAPRLRAWVLSTDFVPRSARINGLGRCVLLGDDPHAVVIVDSKGKVVGDYPLKSFLKGKALQTARNRTAQGVKFHDDASFAEGMASEGRFRFSTIKGVNLKRLPRHEGYTIWQGSVWVLGESVFFVRVGADGYGWFDPVDGELLSTDVPREP